MFRIIDGVGFDTSTPSNNIVKFQSANGTANAIVMQAGLTQLQIRIPDDAADGDVTVSVNAQTSNSFHYHPARTIP